MGLFGDLKLRVPPGTRVRQRGFSLGGDSEVNLNPAPDGPELTVKVYGLLTDVEITDESPEAGQRPHQHSAGLHQHLDAAFEGPLMAGSPVIPTAHGRHEE